MRKRRQVVPEFLVARIDDALGAVDDAGAELARVVEDGAPRQDRREAHAKLRSAYDQADALLRQATALARPRSYREWSSWRERLSAVDTARQQHLLAEQDEPGIRPIGTVRAVDTGMSGPNIGDLQHGEARPAGTPAAYGLDIEAVLTADGAQLVEPVELHSVSEPPVTALHASPHEAA